MTRVKSPESIRHRKIKSLARGFRGARRRRVVSAHEALMHAGQYAYAGRKLKRRDLRSLWITRINAATREHGLSYGKFISLLKKNKIELDRKILSEIAATDPHTFEKILQEVTSSVA